MIFIITIVSKLDSYNMCVMKKEFLQKYYKILSPEYPEFIKPYLKLPKLKRLDGVGLLCGTYWNSLYNNKFFYSRLDHSIGVALIVWNFTKDREQTLSALFHDVSTPVFSHVIDFLKDDAATQTSTETINKMMLHEDKALMELLVADSVEKIGRAHV